MIITSKKGSNNKVKPPITLRKSINKLNYGCIESMKRRLKLEVISRKSQKHKLCNVDTSEVTNAVTQFLKSMGKMLQV